MFGKRRSPKRRTVEGMENKISLKFYSIHQIKINITDTKTFVFTQMCIQMMMIFYLFYRYRIVYRTLNSCH